ncbi:MAG: hypothetical protein QNK31_12710 [Porticoccus sp.]|nr:hypothetical protein [Porticoccus sp.]
MLKLIAFILMFIHSAISHAETPPEIQGVWVPDVEKTIVLMKKNMGDIDSAFMRDRYLPNLKRTITQNKYIHTNGKREYTADISLKEKNGSRFIMVLTSELTPDMLITFTPKEKDGYIMMSENPSDGSGNILWVKQ